MDAFEDKIQASVAQKIIPGCVLTATTRSAGYYAEAFGAFDFEDPEGRAMDVDVPMEIMSCTKFMTSVAVLQCVERGILDLDEDIVKFLPEFKDKKILAGFDDNGEAILKENLKPITLRHVSLLSSLKYC